MTERKRVYTTGDVARICQVAPRTVSKWFDEGHLKGYRIPGSNDRRIPLEELVRFMREHGMPLRGLDTGLTRILVVMSDRPYATSVVEALNLEPSFECATAESAFGAGMVSAEFDPHIILVDVEMSDPIRVDKWKRAVGNEARNAPRFVAITTDEASAAGLVQGGFDACLIRPFKAAEAVRTIHEVLSRETAP